MSTTSESVQVSFLTRLVRSLQREFQRYLDDSVPHAAARYVGLVVTLLVYFLRVYSLQGFYIVTYALGIYLLNLVIGFLSPQDDPESDSFTLPSTSTDEFKPFVRRLPEFKFWFVLLLSNGMYVFNLSINFRYSSMKAILIALVCTFFSFIDVPVFWPILLIYFIVLLFLTMRRQINHVRSFFTCLFAS